MMEIVLLIVLAALAVLSFRSLLVLGTASVWTSLGWGGSLLYALVAAYEIAAHRPLPPILPYGLLAIMTVAFVIAGVRDEAQAVPWFWPRMLGSRRAKSDKR